MCLLITEPVLKSATIEMHFNETETSGKDEKENFLEINKGSKRNKVTKTHF